MALYFSMLVDQYSANIIIIKFPRKRQKLLFFICHIYVNAHIF